MKQYPSIENHRKAPCRPCLGFVKYDGSNIRAEWSRKTGFYKFGTRNVLLDENSMFGPVIPLFREKYEEPLTRVFRTQKYDSVIVFAEWFGAKSFAGQHVEDDDPKDIVLFDVNPLRKGFLAPRQFLDLFGHLPVAELVYEGDLDESLIRAVQSDDFSTVDFRSRYPITTQVPEGVVCKGGSGHTLWMRKVKSKHYFDELRNRKPEGWEKLLEDDV